MALKDVLPRQLKGEDTRPASVAVNISVDQIVAALTAIAERPPVAACAYRFDIRRDALGRVDSILATPVEG